MSISLNEIFKTMPVAELEAAIDRTVVWYNALVQRYARDVGQGVQNLQRDEAIVFFRSALQFWTDSKPQLSGELMDAETIIKTRICLGQIKSLNDKLRATDITLEELNLDSNSV
jgi:hypothetical protein